MKNNSSLFSLSIKEIKNLLEINVQVSDLSSTLGVLHWDQETYMPTGGIETRANQMATLSGLLHKLSTSNKINRLIESLNKRKERGELNIYDEALLREWRRTYEREIKVPRKLVEALTKTESLGMEFWQKARKESKFSIFRAPLSKIIDLKFQEANYVGYQKTPYNLFLDDHEPGLTTEVVDSIFSDLKDITISILRKIHSVDYHIDQDVLRKNLAESDLWNFTIAILKTMGFDFDRGRQDRSVHPFTINFGVNDVRVTTRFGEQFFTSSIFSTIHEGGHALYNQGIDPKLSRTILSNGTSLAIHESQSRFWENYVGRSAAFWQHWYPRLVQAFPNSGLEAAHEGDFVLAVNKIEPNLIRVDSDEITYNLHIILRYEIERDIFAGRLQIKDLPEVWDAKVKEYLGIEVPSDAKGVLQDIHWSHGSFGYFPTYSLGNLYAAQIYKKAKDVFSDFEEKVSTGEMLFLRDWLKENIHRHGATYQAQDLIKKITGETLNTNYFREYLEDKFSRIYHYSK